MSIYNGAEKDIKHQLLLAGIPEKEIDSIYKYVKEKDIQLTKNIIKAISCDFGGNLLTGMED